MTERERDKLLLGLKAGQDEIKSNVGEIKRVVNRILGTVQGLAAARVESEGRLAGP